MESAISYDANNARWKQVYTNAGNTETTNYIGGLMEKIVDASGTNYRHYIYSQTNTAAVAIMSRKSDGTNATYYVLDDHQQSPSNLRDASGNLVVNESYTAYGNRRNWSTWSGAAASSELTTSANITRQGYTWQTALGNMGLNHMNGRVQDATTGIFLSADPYISEPTNTQNYNRYAYVYNNPLSLTDPSGFWACDWTMGFTMAGGTGSGVSYGGGGLTNNVAAGLGGNYAGASQTDEENYWGRAKWQPGMTDLMSYQRDAVQKANTRFATANYNYLAQSKGMTPSEFAEYLKNKLAKSNVGAEALSWDEWVALTLVVGNSSTFLSYAKAILSESISSKKETGGIQVYVDESGQINVVRLSAIPVTCNDSRAVACMGLADPDSTYGRELFEWHPHPYYSLFPQPSGEDYIRSARQGAPGYIWQNNGENSPIEIWYRGVCLEGGCR